MRRRFAQGTISFRRFPKSLCPRDNFVSVNAEAVCARDNFISAFSEATLFEGQFRFGKCEGGLRKENYFHRSRDSGVAHETIVIGR